MGAKQTENQIHIVLGRISSRIDEKSEALKSKHDTGNPHITAALIAIETVKNAILEEILNK